MKAEQIIYTSCKKGITGETSGFQTYSYSPQIATWEVSNQLGVLFAKFNGETMPSELPILPTEEEAREIFPRRYSYRRIEGNDDLCGISLCSYIGRDYPENSQRSGNFLGHGFVFSEIDCKINPGQLINVSSFMQKIDPVLVRKDERPALLQSVELPPSDSSSIESIQEFLSEDYRADIFKQMLACLLNGKDKQYNRVKHIFINDKPTNIQLWISALMMVFPIKNALEIWFSTYEFDPVNSPASIVGVAKNTKYSSSKSADGVDYYFDFTDNIVDSTNFSELNEFCDFACDSLMYSYENLQAFHGFLEQFAYSSVDTCIKDAHNLSLLMQGVLSFDDYSIVNVKDFLSFSSKYANKDFNLKLADLIFQQLRIPDVSDELFDTLADFLNALSAKNVFAVTSLNEKITKISVDHFCNLDYVVFHAAYSRFDKMIPEGINKYILPFIEGIDVKSWSKPDCVMKPSFVVWLYAKNRELISGFLNKGSYQHIILERLLHMLDICADNEAHQAIRYIFSEYKKAGRDSLSTLYLAIKLLAKSLVKPIATQRCIDEFQRMLTSFSEADRVSILQVLYSKGFEDDIAYVVNFTEKDASSDLLLFVKLIDKHLPSYFSNNKRNLLRLCFGRAKNLSDKYKVFVFAAKIEKFSTIELKEILLEASADVAVVKIPDTQKEYIDGFSDYCLKLNIDIPQNVVLAGLNLHLADIYKTSVKLFSSDKKLVKSVQELLQATFQVDKLSDENRQKYLCEVARNVAYLALKSMELPLQDSLFSLDSQTQLFFNSEVFRNACDITKKSRDYEPLIYLVVYNSFSHHDMNDFMIDYVDKSGISPSSLIKSVEKETTLEGLEKYYNTLNPRATENFTVFFKRWIAMLKPVQESSILDSVRDGVVSFFKKKSKGD